jgi:hypothetical protein
MMPNNGLAWYFTPLIEHPEICVVLTFLEHAISNVLVEKEPLVQVV